MLRQITDLKSTRFRRCRDSKSAKEEVPSNLLALIFPGLLLLRREHLLAGIIGFFQDQLSTGT
jgi:hypothetical protein